MLEVTKIIVLNSQTIKHCAQRAKKPWQKAKAPVGARSLKNLNNLTILNNLITGPKRGQPTPGYLIVIRLFVCLHGRLLASVVSLDQILVPTNSSRDKETKGHRDKGTKGQRDKRTKGQRDKRIKGQRDKGTKE